jgi:hypothetical protein
MEAEITIGYRRHAPIAEVGVRIVIFVLRNIERVGSAGSAGIRAVDVRGICR